MADPEVIYLQPDCGEWDDRTWCVNNVWPDGPGDGPTGIKYIRADIAEGQVRAAVDGARREAVPERLRRYIEVRNTVKMLGTGDVIHAVHTGTEHSAELCLSDLNALLAPPSPDPVAVAREAVVLAAMDRHNFQGGALDACDAVERKLDEACDALVALEAPQAAPAKHACHDCGCKIPAEFDLCGNCQMGRDEGEPT